MSDNKSITAAATLSRLLSACQAQTEKCVKSCAEKRRFHQVAVNKATPLWLIGHMANTAEFIGNSIGMGAPTGAVKEPWRKKFSPDFFGGDKITTNAADYPAWDEVVQAYSKVMAGLAQSVAKLSDEQLLGPPLGKLPEPLKQLVSTVQDCVTLNIIHDSHHRGQFALLANAPE